jgi:alanine-synthesizing transaminase
VVAPNNPTGSYLKLDELERLSGLGLPIISDEVFAEYPLKPDARRAESALYGRAPLVLALGGLSKSVGLPQLKLAWVALGGEEAQVGEALSRLELIADAFLSPGTPVQQALPGLLSEGCVVRRAILDRALTNLASLRALLSESAATVLDVEGGWYATLKLPSTRSEGSWAKHLLEHGVAVQPGAFFDFQAEPYVVVSLIVPEPEFRRGIERLRACVDAP